MLPSSCVYLSHAYYMYFKHMSMQEDFPVLRERSASPFCALGYCRKGNYPDKECFSTTFEISTFLLYCTGA